MAVSHFTKYAQLHKERTESQQESVLVFLVAIVKLEIQNLIIEIGDIV